MAPNPVTLVTDNLETPTLDDRSYRVIKLQNQLEALLVHDPDTDKASASVSVDVGNFSDAEDMPGMAHAVEHLLFMGTKKFPSENEYNRFLAAHSGYSNAYTAATQTNYYFEVASTSDHEQDGKAINGHSTSPLYGALDRFAQFFISPLFLPSTLDRELRAVDSENKKNLQSDNWRQRQLDKSLSSFKHPYHSFSTGNLETLRDKPKARGLDVREEFMRFHDKHYSANRMKLVVLGKESLDQLSQWVSELFADVQNKDLHQNRWDGPQPYTAKELGSTIFAKPVMDSRSIELRFPFLDETEMYDTQPSRYISHLIGHEGPGSILSLIKDKGLANTLSAGAHTVCPGTGFFDITIKLTEEGLQRYQEVVAIIFEYIALLKQQPPQKWIMDEIMQLAEVSFMYREKTPASAFASSMSSVMQKPLPREWLLSGSELVRRFDADIINKAMTYLTPDNFRMMLVSQQYPGTWNQKETWYGTEYRVDRFEPKFAASLEKAFKSGTKDRHSELHLPGRNEFIPSNLDVVKKEVASPAKAPKLIRNDDLVRMWWKKDDTFWFPKGFIFINLRNAYGAGSPGNVVRSRLFCELVKDALVEYSYDAELSGLNYSFSAPTIGLGIDVEGYNDKLPVLLKKVLLTIRDLQVKQDRFDVVKERLMRAFRNWAFQQPYKQVSEYFQWLNAEQAWIVNQYKAELEPVTAQDIIEFQPRLLQQMHIEAMCFGNMHKEDALKLADLVEEVFKPRVLPQTQWPVKRNMLLPPGSNFTYRQEQMDPANVNNCIDYYIAVGDVTDRLQKAKLFLLAQLTEEAAFDQLRTKEQLGYIVWTSAKINSATIGYAAIIQSERSNDYLEGRINAFLQMFGGRLEAMSSEEFESHKKSLVHKRLEKVKNMSQECWRLWHYISTEYCDFNEREKDVELIKPLTKSDMLEFFHKFIDPQSPHRAKISVHIDAQVDGSASTSDMTLTEKSQKTAVLFCQTLGQLGGDVDADKLQSSLPKLQDRFVKLGDDGWSSDKILQSLQGFLKSDLALSKDFVTQVSDQIRPVLATVLSSNGIPLTAASASQQDDADLTPAPDVAPVTIIEDVRNFKAGLRASAGPRPVTNLTEFEDFDAKL